MDRLLRPNTALGNDSQNKKFTSSDNASVDRHARVSTFYLQKNQEAPTYLNTREFKTGQFSGRSYDTTTANSLLAARSTSPVRSYDTPSARASVELRDSHRTASSSNFAGSRTFLDEGKSQKSLSRKNKPMTIDDIRELLNKSK